MWPPEHVPINVHIYIYVCGVMRKEAVGKIAPAMRDLPVPFHRRVYEDAPTANLRPPLSSAIRRLAGREPTRVVESSAPSIQARFFRGRSVAGSLRMDPR
jgi:hypothetical protein